MVALNSQRIALIVQYQGTHFHGWQYQPGQRTVQSELETALGAVAGHPVRVHGAGRTDAGVHAAAQVAHFETPSPIPATKWARILNQHLPPDLNIRGSAAVPPRWHAQFSALWRRYRYTLYTDAIPNLFAQPFCWHYYHAPLDTEQMQAALTPLLGRHHLAAFRRAGSPRKDSWVTIQDVHCTRRPPFIEVEIQADGFLYGMVRLLIGVLIEVGNGVRSLESFQKIWVNQRRDLVKYSAPAKGLCLLRVGYPDFPFPKPLWFDTQPLLMFNPVT
ncbi:MAG: tRNA pseudouridine(38-40) synthase TruA [Spirulina sp. SIO3F2]|nr:tRNA pseudouridine(38-40) synthase TruA [Spirulina sp. SIO3F2]